MVGDDRDAVEQRFFESWMRGETLAPVTATAVVPGRPPSDVIGLFPQPGAPR
jgi:hypothetical protein